MGTSLSGLTPATTFDGLLKTSDNQPLDGTLKAISTGDGTDTILQLSDSALSIGGNTSVSGGVNTSASNALTIQNSDGTQLFAVRNDGRLLLGTSSNIMYIDDALLQTWLINNSYFSGQRVGIGVNASGSYRLHVKGSGATSATTSLLVQNSAGTDMLKVQDDGVLNVSDNIIMGTGKAIFSGDSGHGIYLNGFSSMLFRSNTKDFVWTTQNGTLATLKNDGDFGIGETTPTARLHVKGSGNDNTTTSLLVQNSSGTTALEVLDNRDVKFNLGSYQFLSNGFTSFPPVYVVNNARIGLGSGGADLARLQVKGSGATSATTALLVQNSAGTELMKVADDGISNVWLASSGLKMQRSSACRLEVKGLGDATNIDISPWSGSMSIGGANVNKVSVGSTTPLDSKFSIKGSGNDNTTTALLVQNSDGDDMFSVRDDGKVNINNDVYVQGAIYGDSNTKLRVGTNLNVASTRAWIQGLGATSATTALLVQNSAGTDLMKVGDDGLAIIKSALITANTHLAQYVSGTNWYIHVNGSTTIGRGSGAVASAVLEVDSTTKGFLPPRMTETERDAISSPAAGLMVYNTTTNKAQCYNGTAWQDLF